MSSREESATGDEPVVAEPSKREVEPVEADHVGALLCATRMRAGGDLQEIAKVLRIRYGYLVAIEDGRHEDLPGSAYSIGFIRAYADYLGLDGNEVVRRLREETNGTVTTARFKFPAPSGESGLPNGGVLAIAVVMGMVVYGAWYTITNADRDAVDLIQEVPDRLAGLIDAQEQDVVDGRGFTKEDTTSLSRTDDTAAAPNESDNETKSSDVALTTSQGEGESEALDEAEIVSEPNVDVDAMGASETAQTLIESAESADVSVVVASADVKAEVSVQPQEADSGGQQIVNPTESTESINPVSEGEFSEVVDAPIVSEATPIAVEETSQLAAVEPIETETVEPSSATAPTVSETNESSSRGMANDSAALEGTAVATTSVGTTFVEPDASPVEATVVSSDAKVEIASEERDETPLPDPADAIDKAEIAGVETAVSTESTLIELRAKSDSWIQVRDGDELLLTRLLREGEVYRVPDRDGLTLMTGNAGGLEVFVGGEQVPPLGDKGVVRRGVPLNAERLRTGVAPG